jgi:hypothetical protein
MPRKPWVPLPHEAKRFHEIYIDETSQNGHHFLVLGGIIIPLELSADFEADMISARRKPLDSRGGVHAKWDGKKYQTVTTLNTRGF